MNVLIESNSIQNKKKIKMLDFKFPQKKTNFVFQSYYYNIVCEDFILKESIKSAQTIPQISKISINHSSSIIVKNLSYLIPVLSGLHLITGQKPQLTKAKNSISGFQLRENQLIGCKITLRKNYLDSFMENLLITVLPRSPILKLENSQLLQSNFNFGFEQMLLYPELEGFYDYFDFFKGTNLNISTTATTIQSNRLILTAFKIPLLTINNKKE